MMSSTTFVLILLSAGSLALGAEEKVNPIRKITGMLEDMSKELEHEQENEAEIFDKAMCICETGTKELQTVIDTSTSEIARLESKIDAETAEKLKMDKDLKAHKQDKTDTEASLAEALEIREKDNEKFMEQEKMNAFSISQLDKAIPLFEEKKAAAFMQAGGHGTLKKIVESTSHLTVQKKDAMIQFLEGAMQVAKAPSSAAAEIIGMMKAMRDEMATDLAESRRMEQEDLNTYNEMKEQKETHLGNLMKMLSDKQKRSGELALSLSEDKDSLEDQNTELANAQKYLVSLQEACEQRRKDRDMRAKMRADEIAAISEAIKILTDDDALEVFKKAVPGASLVSVKQQPVHTNVMDEWTDFLQTDQHRATVHDKVRNVLKKASTTLTNVQQHRMGSHARPGEAPGVQKNADQASKVVDFMIDNMVEGLHDDDVDDEHKKNWCANETEVMYQVKADKEALTDQLTKAIEVMDSDLKKLTEDIQTLKMEINDVDIEVRDSTVLRKKEHDEFLTSYQGMDIAIKLVKKATARLQKFYNPSMTAFVATSANQPPAPTESPPSAAVQQLMGDVASLDDESFIQIHTETRRAHSGVDPIELPDTPKTYEKKESGGVVGLMNDMVAELTSDSKESETEEKYAAKDYVKLMKEAKENRAAMVKAMKQKILTKAETEEKRQQAHQRNELTIDELKHLELYLVQLHAECDFLVRNYDNRHEARVEEEGGLDAAESIVTHEEVPSHNEIAKVYEQEHAQADVEKHFPHQDLPTGF